MTTENNALVTTLTEQVAAETSLTLQQDGQTVVQPATVAEKLLSGASGNFITTVKNDGTPASAAKIFNAINDNNGNIKDMVNKTLVVTDLMAFPVSIVDLNGEMQDGIRVVLITKNGESYGSVAQGVFSSLQNIIAICGMGPWENGIKLTPVMKKTRRGFQTLVFRMEA